MAPDERPSDIVPVLMAMLVCDTAAVDPSTGKKSLVGIFDRVWVAEFPTQRAVTIYAKLTDAQGYYRFKVRYVQTGTGQTLAEVQGDAQVADRLVSPDFVLQTPPLPIPEAGRYEFQLWMNEIFVGSTFIDAAARSS